MEDFYDKSNHNGCHIFHIFQFYDQWCNSFFSKNYQQNNNSYDKLYYKLDN